MSYFLWHSIKIVAKLSKRKEIENKIVTEESVINYFCFNITTPPQSVQFVQINISRFLEQPVNLRLM